MLLLYKNLYINLKKTDCHSGYIPYPCKCKNCRGILTYIRNDITGEVEETPDGTTDIQKITVWWNDLKYTLLNVYSPPETTCSLPSLQEPCYTRTIVCGDFNGHSPRWGYTDLNSTGKYLEELADTSTLTIIQDEHSPTTLLHRVHKKTCFRPYTSP